MDGNSHNYEVYHPANHLATNKVPCVILFHSGSWENGDLVEFSKQCQYFASRGIVAITANYSMHTAATLPTLAPGESKKRICVIDGKTVIRLVKSRANQLGIDPNRVVVGGASAGGHISVLAIMDELYNNPTDPTGVDMSVKGFMLFCPAFTLLNKESPDDVNVFNNLNKPYPPTLFILGETDGWKPASDALAVELVKRGNNVQAWMAKGQGHMFHRSSPWYEVSLIKADEFLVSLGILQGSSTITPPATGETLTKITITPPPTNKVPVVSFAAPTGNITLNTGANLYVKVNATDSDGTISNVKLYKNNVALARTEGGAPYEWNAAGQNDPELKNLQAGSFALKAVATDNGGATGQATITVTVVTTPPPVGANDATFVTSEVPGMVAPGATFDAKVTYVNSGTSTWTDASGFNLGSQSPQDNVIWGSTTSRTSLTTSVAPGESYTFTIKCTAPTTAGNYDFQRRMVQTGVEWFGDYSNKQVIVVGVATVGNKSQFVSSDAPSSVKVGQAFTVNVTMLNVGTNKWTATGNYKLGSQNPQDNKIWGTNRTYMTSTASVATGQSYTFKVTCKAPATAGTYNFQQKMLQEGVQWFDAITPNKAIVVSQ
jgi:acetyl esterase/lipase